MKGVVFIFTLLLLQVSGSFFDRFNGALSNVNRGFGKLITDIVTDVKDTVTSTLSTVNEVLGLKGMFDKVSSNHKHETVEKPLSNSFEHGNQRAFDYNSLRHPINHYEFATKRDAESHDRNVDKRKSDVLAKYAIIESAEESFKDDTNRMEEIIKSLKWELENISSNVKSKMKRYNFDANRKNEESIWEKIKTLDDVHRKSTNSSERKEIRSVLDKISNKLHLETKGKETLDNHDLDEMKKKLQELSNIKNEPHKKDEPSHLNIRDKAISKEVSKLNNTFATNILKDVHDKFGKKYPILKSNQSQSRQNQLSVIKKDEHKDNSVFSLDLSRSDILTPFSNSASVSKADLDSAKILIEDSEHNDKVLSDFFRQKHDSVDVFSNADLFGFDS